MSIFIGGLLKSKVNGTIILNGTAMLGLVRRTKMILFPDAVLIHLFLKLQNLLYLPMIKTKFYCGSLGTKSICSFHCNALQVLSIWEDLHQNKYNEDSTKMSLEFVVFYGYHSGFFTVISSCIY